MKIYTYSERGIVNSLIYSLSEEHAKELLCSANSELKNPEDITIYLEHSLSDFGSPDVIITYNEGKKFIVVFVEAKVSNGNKKWSLKKQYEDFKDKKPKDITSNIFRQFALKELLMNNKNKAEDGISCDDKNKRIMGNKTSPRKIGNNNVVKKFFNKIKDADDYWFLGLVPDNALPDPREKDKAVFDKLKLLTWKQIAAFAEAKGLNDLKDSFSWNNGIIYNAEEQNDNS